MWKSRSNSLKVSSDVKNSHIIGLPVKLSSNVNKQQHRRCIYNQIDITHPCKHHRDTWKSNSHQHQYSRCSRERKYCLVYKHKEKAYQNSHRSPAKIVVALEKLYAACTWKTDHRQLMSCRSQHSPSNMLKSHPNLRKYLPFSFLNLVL